MWVDGFPIALERWLDRKNSGAENPLPAQGNHNGAIRHGADSLFSPAQIFSGADGPTRRAFVPRGMKLAGK